MGSQQQGGREWLLTGIESQPVDDSGEGEDVEGLGMLSAVVMNVNMVLGAGVVGLPFAFYHAGATLSIAFLLAATLMASATMGYIVEATAWMEGWLTADEQQRQLKQVLDATSETPREPATEDGEGADGADGVEVELSEEAQRTSSEETRQSFDPDQLFRVRGRQFELSELCDFWLAVPVSENSRWRCLADSSGKIQIMRRIIEVAVVSYCVGTCWLYSTVFSSSLYLVLPMPLEGRPQTLAHCLIDCSLRTNVTCHEGMQPCNWVNGTCQMEAPIAGYCNESYQIFLLFFAIIMLGLASFDAKGLSSVQLGMGAFALMALITMVVTCLVAIFYDHGANRGFDKMPATDLSGLGKLVTAAIFSQLCHQGVPTIVGSLRDKSSAKSVFRITLLYTFSLYTVLCLVTAYYFGPNIVAIITLNWEDYTGGSQAGMPIAWWASTISTMVMLFPVITVTAAYPLNVIPLSETVAKLLPASIGTPENMVLLRAILSLLPIGAASVVRDVGRILEFNGMFGFVIGFFMPCILFLAARRQSMQRFGIKASRTPYYTWPASDPVTVLLIIFLTLVIAGYTAKQVGEDYMGMHDHRR